MSSGSDPRAFEAPAVRAQRQAQALRALVAFAWERAPGWRRRLEAAGIDPGSVRGIDDLQALPILHKDELIELQAQEPPFGGLLGVPVDRLRHIFVSPGPIFDPEGEKTDYWRWAPALAAAGLKPGMVVLNAFAYHLTPAGQMFDEGARALGCVVIPGGIGNKALQVQVMARLGVEGYIGLPSYLMALLEAAREEGLSLSLKAAFVTAEMFPESMRRELAEVHGIHARQGYGTADLGMVAYECEVAQGMHVGEDVIVELVDPATGEGIQEPGRPGEVVVTLLEETYPLLRFGTGDLSAWAEGACSCGRTSRRLAGILGRVGAGVKVRGLFVHPHQADQVVARFPQIARYQMVVSREGHLDRLTFRLLPEGSVPGEEVTQAFLAAVREVLKVRAEVEWVETLPDDAPKVVDTRRWE